MIDAVCRAAAAVFEPGLRRVFGLCLCLAGLTFAALWLAAGVALTNAQLFVWRPLNGLVDVLGAAGILAATWLLFPAVVTMVMGFFLERIAGVIEKRDYPGRGPPRRASIRETARVTLRLMGVSIGLNVLAIPVYLLAPGINFFVFLGLNGYLFGREYFEVVALRRLDPIAAGVMRRQFAGRVFVGGLAIVGFFAVPLVNLVAPVLATVFMLHLFEGLRSAQPQFSTL